MHFYFVLLLPEMYNSFTIDNSPWLVLASLLPYIRKSFILSVIPQSKGDAR